MVSSAASAEAEGSHESSFCRGCVTSALQIGHCDTKSQRIGIWSWNEALNSTHQFLPMD